MTDFLFGPGIDPDPLFEKGIQRIRRMPDPDPLFEKGPQRIGGVPGVPDVFGDFLSEMGFGGAQTGADIVRMLGVQDTALHEQFGKGLDPLFGTVRKGLGELPGLLATLTGQARTTAGLGRERVGLGFQTGRAGLEERAIGLGRGGRMATARAGFAGGGAIPGAGRRGRRQLGQQFMDILGARRTGLAGVEAGLERGLFGAGEAVESRRAGLFGSLGTGIQNLLNALISGGVEFGGDGMTQEERNKLINLGDESSTGKTPPANPALGHEWTDLDGITRIWTGRRWEFTGERGRGEF